MIPVDEPHSVDQPLTKYYEHLQQLYTKQSLNDIISKRFLMKI